MPIWGASCGIRLRSWLAACERFVIKALQFLRYLANLPPSLDHGGGASRGVALDLDLLFAFVIVHEGPLRVGARSSTG